jgi:uncharacterized protein (TIGR00159 family)
MFFEIRILDVIDILLVAFLLYQIYRLIRGTVAINIFAGILSLYALWFVVRALKMELLSAILGQILGVGVLALLIVFQQEVRKFLLLIGSQYFNRRQYALSHLFFHHKKKNIKNSIESILRAAQNMSAKKTGALIVIKRKTSLESYEITGDRIGAIVSNRLLENIFFKNSPLHDGAVIIDGDCITYARCVLPISEQLNLPSHYGMRHRAAIGISEVSDAAVVVVSEETGAISFALEGNIHAADTAAELQEKLLHALNL